MNYTNKQIEDLLTDIYAGRVTQRDLPEDLYLATAQYLEKGVYEGFKGNLSNFNYASKDYELLSELRDNTYLFSGAKTYQQVREMSSFVADSANFGEFKDKALEVYDQYNKNWLATEYNTAIGQAMQARQWNDIQKDKETFPYLRYSAIIDGRTSDICEPLNNVTLPVDDPLWDEYTPLNHFNCRCILEQIDKLEDVKLTPKSEVDAIKENLDENVQDLFKMNAGKDGYVFSDEHPYFEVAPKDRELAQRNFDLPIPEPPAPKEELHPFNIPKLKELGVDLNQDIYNLLKRPPKMELSIKGAFAKSSRGEIYIDYTGQRWKNSEVYREKLLYHELGHLSHTQLDLITTNTGIVSEEYAKHFAELKKMVKFDAPIIDKSLNDLYMKGRTLKGEELTNLLSKYNCKNYEDLKELIGGTSDSLQALTNSKHGYGHAKSYMSMKSFKEAEMYAHSCENYFGGNKVFEEFMPNVFKSSKEFIAKQITKLK